MNGLLHKARKPKFELTLQIIDLNNVPLVAGKSYIKWHLPMSTAAEHRGATSKEPIKDHKVTWNYEKKLLVRLSMDRTNMLQECQIDFEVIQDYNYGGRGEKITIGKVRLNLAEYADLSGDDGECVTRRYLMQDSKINSTVKVGLGMMQVDGDRNFIAPPLKTAAVFEGFTGVIASEQEPDKMGHMGSSAMNKELGELQDMYRLALAASWACGSGELAADKCIEDIFNGGDGWGNKAPPESQNPSLLPQPQAESEDEGAGTATPSNPRRDYTRRNGTPRSTTSSSSRGTQQMRSDGEMPGLNSTTDKGGYRKGGVQTHESGGDKQDGSPTSSRFDRGWHGVRHSEEIPEWAIREDLRAWKMPVMDSEGGTS